MRALAANRFALAQAAAGNTRGFHAAADEARALLDTPGALDTRPAHLSSFGPEALERMLAQGALTLAAVTSRDSRRLLDDADAALGGTGTDAAMPSHAVFHAACLSRAHVAADDLDRAVPAGLTALRRRLPTVRSRRCELVLRRLEADLAALPPTRRPAPVRSLQDQLCAAHTT
ncbi:MAG: hypothetical protein ACT4NY_17620 [Pseudonocardiales bacterium]